MVAAVVPPSMEAAVALRWGDVLVDPSGRRPNLVVSFVRRGLGGDRLVTVVSADGSLASGGLESDTLVAPLGGVHAPRRSVERSIEKEPLIIANSACILYSHSH